MTARHMLDQLLRSGLDLLNNGAGGSAPAATGAPSAPSTRATPATGASSTPGRDTDWRSFGQGAAAAGVLALLLGTRRGRRLGGKAVKYGGLAAIGVMAYRAFEQWQATQAPTPTAPGSAAQAAPGAGPMSAPVPALPPPRTIDQNLPADEAEAHSRAMLMAMVAAAKADGHLDANERQLLDVELGRLAAEHDLKAWVDELLARPLDAAEVARASTGPELGAEIYLASLLVADEQSPAERVYLDELARQLQLAPELQARLEAQANAG